MKVEFEIECTPEEARKFLGLPDVIPMQDALMKQLQAKLSENIRTLDPESLAKTWVPLTMQGWGEMQKMFWGQMNAARGRAGAGDPKGEDSGPSSSVRKSKKRGG
jgi:hypothetical protein